MYNYLKVIHEHVHVHVAYSELVAVCLYVCVYECASWHVRAIYTAFSLTMENNNKFH